VSLPGNARSLVLLAAGILLLLASTRSEFAYVRVFAVVLLVAAGAGIGIAAGVTRRSGQPDRTRSGVFHWVGCTLAVLLVAPALAALAVALSRGSMPAPDWMQNFADGIVALVLLAAAVASLAIAVRAIRSCGHAEPGAKAP